MPGFSQDVWEIQECAAGVVFCQAMCHWMIADA